MELTKLNTALWLLLPALCASVVWWSWARGRQEHRDWRQSATFLSAAATMANVLIGLAVLMWVNDSERHMSAFTQLLALVVYVTSIVAAILGRGRLRWLIIPAAAIQGFGWMIVFLALSGGPIIHEM